MTPVEIIALGLIKHHENASGPVRYKCSFHALPTHLKLKFTDQAEAAIAALEAAGYRIVSAETVTDEMQDAFYAAGSSFAEVLAVAPLYGKG